MVIQDNLKISTRGFCDIINITKEVMDIVAESEIKNGLVTVFAKGSAAGITTIEYEEGLIKDFQEAMERLAPQNQDYHHNQKWGDGNGSSHIRASFLGPSLSIPLEEWELILGTWQQIILADFDNRGRQREIIVQVAGNK